MKPNVLHDKGKQKFYVVVDNGDEAYVRYRMVDEGRIHFLTTFVPPRQRGKGIARLVVEAALDYAREKHFIVSTSCWYIEKFLDKSDAYRDLAG